MSFSLKMDPASMKAQAAYMDTSSRLGDVLQRMSSGLRISKGTEDATSVDVASKLQLDSKVYAQGLDNFNKGINLVDAADKAVEALQNIASKITALATQSAGDTVSLAQRKALNEEAQALSKEFSRIIRTTDYNNKILLSGEFGDVSFQGSYGAESAISGDMGQVTGDGTFDSGSVAGTDGNTYFMSYGDFNGDGNLDMVNTNQAGNSVKIHLGNGDGTFTAGSSYSIGAGAFRPTYVNVADFNNDGIMDLQTTNTNSDNVSVLLGNGDGTFGAATTYTSSTNSFASVVGDFNGDNILDIVTTSSDTNNVGFLAGNGDGTFSAVALDSYASATNTYGVKSADFNGDGILDIAMMSHTDRKMYIMTGNGDGSFTEAGAYTTPTYGYYLDVGDFNNDGVVDIVASVTGSGASKLSIYSGNGDATFTKVSDINVAAGGINEIKLRDVDGDGNLDIAVGSFPGTNLYTFSGNGNGTFDNPLIIGSVPNSETVLVADFNNDGVNDIVSSSNSTSTIKIFLQNTTTGTSSLGEFDISTKGGATQALSMLERKMTALDGQRSEIQAFKSRLQYGRENARYATEAAITGADQMLNADQAQEAASAIKLKMVEQVSKSILAQANLQPKFVLDLISLEN